MEKVSKWLPYSIYGYRAITQGVLETAASIVAGAGSQTIVESMGKVGIDRFLRSHQLTLAGKQPNPLELTASSEETEATDFMISLW